MNPYGIIIAVGIVICLVAAYFTAKKRGIEGDIVIDIIIFCLPLAILGARIYYVIFDAANGGNWTFSRFFGVGDDGLHGLAIYGGLIGALIGAALLVLWKRRKKNPEDKRISFMQLADLGFTFIILGQAIGRWGNFANQEAYGYRITDQSQMWFPLGVFIDKDSSWHYATFFYESLWNTIGFALLLFLYLGKRKSFDGFVLACYCIYYGIGRAWIEGMRSDSLWLGSVRVSQLLSIFIIAFGVAYIIAHIVRAKRAGKKVFIFVDQSKLNDGYYTYDKTKLAHPMPDIKRKKKEEVVFDDNGVAIRQTDDDDIDYKVGSAEAEQISPLEGPKEDELQANEAVKQVEENTEQTETEEPYEDRWDD